ncbi:hypothetical protein RJ641_013399 [Dillenia turbinata]|uniref:Uncharacterized protein n=1 Tax=Dillenia turbinata TaxID=194707 RepID=A0AAN8ZUM4_9MAGN
MSLSLLRKWRTLHLHVRGVRSFRSDAALEALSNAAEERVPNVVLYNYPSFSGAYSALFAHRYHSLLNLPCLILPFSSVEPLRVEDLYVEGLETCYFLDFLGPKNFALDLSQRSSCQIIGFDHRRTALSVVPSKDDCPGCLAFHVNLEKSTSRAVYDYFSGKLAEMRPSNVEFGGLLNPEEQKRVHLVLNYIEDVDLRRWSLPDIKKFCNGITVLQLKLNCITNPQMYEQKDQLQRILILKSGSGLMRQTDYGWDIASGIMTLPLPLLAWVRAHPPLLLEVSSCTLIAEEESRICSRQNAAAKLLDKVFKIRLGRGFYGECLGVQVDKRPDLINEMAGELSLRSAAAGLRPIGAVIYMQRKNLKMCLRTTDGATDTSEIAKAYGGGGTPSSSSFIIRMDEYSLWRTL